MTNRRQFLQTGMSMPAWPLAINGWLASNGASARIAHDRVPLHKAVFDARYAQGHAFANAMAGFGVPAFGLEHGDITELFEEVDPLWRRTRAALAGTTQYGPLFVLERLAHERGLHVALRVEHVARDDGTLAHVMAGPAETLETAASLEPQSPDWPVLMAALLCHCRADGAFLSERTIVTRAAKPIAAERAGAPETVIHYYTPHSSREGRGVPWDGPLYSWLIAPRTS